MLTVTYGQLRDQAFGRAMMKLANCSGLKSPKVAYNVAKINKRLVEEAKLADELYQKLVQEYCKKTDTGEMEPHDGRPGTFVIPEDKADEWQGKLKELNAISFEIDRPKVDLEDVQAAASLSPAEILSLEPVLVYDDAPPPSLKAVPRDGK